MLNAFSNFRKGLTEARQSVVLFDFLTSNIGSPLVYDDLLRFQLVYAVSAFDKLLHDLICIGMRDAFIGTRVQTQRYKAETIGLHFHGALAAQIEAEVKATILNLPAPLPPKQVIFEQEIQRKLRFLSFQDPDKISDGLSLIWDERYKWDKIADLMGGTAQSVKTKLRLIVSRRNAIVHEADIDPVIASKSPITRQIAVDSTNFIEHCGSAIAQLVS